MGKHVSAILGILLTIFPNIPKFTSPQSRSVTSLRHKMQRKTEDADTCDRRNLWKVVSLWNINKRNVHKIGNATKRNFLRDNDLPASKRSNVGTCKKHYEKYSNGAAKCQFWVICRLHGYSFAVVRVSYLKDASTE